MEDGEDVYTMEMTLEVVGRAFGITRRILLGRFFWGYFGFFAVYYKHIVSYEDGRGVVVCIVQL